MRKVLAYLIVLVAIKTINANNIEFKHLGLKDGLSQVSVMSMEQDYLGRIWIGTRDGLNVYDGTLIKTFRTHPQDSTSILGHNVRKLAQDGHFIWAITHSGVSRMNTKDLSFERFPFKDVQSILPFEGKVLLGTTRGLFQLDPKTKALTLRSDIFDQNTTINNIIADNAGMLWICSNNGLHSYDIQNHVTTKVLNYATNVAYSDTQKRIWVGTNGNGVFLLNRHKEVLKHLYHNGQEKSITNNIIRDISEDSQGNIWIGTFFGLNIINGRSFQVDSYKQSDSERNQLSHNSVYSILRDKQGTMWVGTYFGGISYYNPNYQIFKYYPYKENNAKGIGYHVVGKMLEDEDNNLWIATEGGGLDYLNRSTNTFTHFKHTEGEPGVSHNNIKSLLMANNNTLFVGTHLGGLNVLDISTGKFTNFKNYNDSLSCVPKVINSIISYKDFYLLATKQGIIKFDNETKQFSDFIEDNTSKAIIGEEIFSLFEDSFGKLWIGTERNGLCMYDTETKTVQRYFSNHQANSISNNTINCIFEDHRFRLWIGTSGGGLNFFDRNNQVFRSYSRDSGHLPSNFVYGIQESRYGNLWVATSKGLVHFHIENDKFYSYDQHSGFPLEELNEGSLCLTSNGEVFVGGINGMVSFKEEDLFRESGDFNLLFTALYLNNKEVKPKDNTKLTNKDMAYVDEIVFKPHQDVFTIHYSACNYVTTNKITYEYRLENFNKEWVNAGNQTSVTYTNLDPGTYNLMVRVLNSSTEKVVDTKNIRLVIKPPFYKTWYAYLIYLVLIVAIIALFNQIYLGRVRLEDNLVAEKREKEQMKEMNASKLRFFTNISHEFRTPLTLITGTLEAVLEDTKTSAKNYKRLLTINNNAVRLNNLISELLDFRKMEQGFLKLKVSEHKVGRFMEEIYQSFVEYAHHHHVKYEFKNPPESLALWFDGNQMEKVFYNLISNAFKVAEGKNGCVVVEVIEQPSLIDITIYDDGPGMPTDRLQKIFDRFYQIDKVSGKTSGQGSGIGLALCKGIVNEHHGEILVKSSEGKGSSFTVRLRKGNKHYSEEQLTTEKTPLAHEISVLKEFDIPDEEGDWDEISDNAPTVLLVEDNHEARNLLKDIFKKHYRIIEAVDGVTGLKSAIANQPDLIISDVMMPNMSGTEMCAKLKRNDQTSHIPIILLTARTAIEYKIEGVETGADDYITKPFNIKLLRARVKNLLQARHILQQKFKQDPKAEVKELTTNSIDQKLLEKAHAIVEKHIDDAEFEINDFAKEMGLGRTRLYTKIKGVTGQTPNDFMMSIRLKKAAQMLVKNSEMNVSEIAYAVGFNTPRYFGRCFREHFGETPTKYLQNIKEQGNSN